MMLKQHTAGLARAGDMAGFFCRVVQDMEDTGGYCLLFSKDFRDAQAEGYDEWYPDTDSLSNRMQELQIEWQN